MITSNWLHSRLSLPRISGPSRGVTPHQQPISSRIHQQQMVTTTINRQQPQLPMRSYNSTPSVVVRCSTNGGGRQSQWDTLRTAGLTPEGHELLQTANVTMFVAERPVKELGFTHPDDFEVRYHHFCFYFL